jgi:hypothetical protein
MTNKQPLQETLKEILQTEDEYKHTHERIGIFTSQEKSRKLTRVA